MPPLSKPMHGTAALRQAWTSQTVSQLKTAPSGRTPALASGGADRGLHPASTYDTRPWKKRYPSTSTVAFTRRVLNADQLDIRAT